MSKPYRISVVCTGNICRSPMGEIILRSMLEDAGLSDRVEVDSAGTDGWEVGDGADPRTLKTLHARGYDGSAHIARQLDAKAVATKDLILVADRGHLRKVNRLAEISSSNAEIRLLREFDDAAVAAGTLEVDDPYYGNAAGFERCFDEVEAACRGVVDHVSARLTS